MKFPAKWRESKVLSALKQNTRKYRTLRVEEIIIETGILNIIKTFVKYLDTLILKKVKFGNEKSLLLDAFDSFKNIKNLFIMDCSVEEKIEKTESSEESSIQLNLTKLVMIGSDQNFVNFLLAFLSMEMKCKSIFLEIPVWLSPDIVESIGNHFKKFLQNQKSSLQSFATKNRFQHEMIVPIFEGLQNMKLETFSFKMIGIDGTASENVVVSKLEDVLKTNKDTLKNLELALSSIATKALIYVVTKDLKIEKLLLEPKELQEFDYTPLMPLPKNPYLKSLILKKSSPAGGIMIPRYNNIEYLTLTEDKDPENQHIILAHLFQKNVKFIHFAAMTKFEMPLVDIPSLKTVWITVAYVYNNYFRFLECNPTIENLYLNGMVDHKVIEEFAENLPNLKKLIIEQDRFEIGSDVLQMLSENCPKLKTIETVYGQKKYPKHEKIKVIKSKKFIIENNLIEKDNSIWYALPEFAKDLASEDRNLDYDSDPSDDYQNAIYGADDYDSDSESEEDFRARFYAILDIIQGRF